MKPFIHLLLFEKSLRRTAAVFGLVVVAACTSQVSTVFIIKPAFTALTDIPNLVGKVSVRLGSQTIATTSLKLTETQAQARLPDLPAGKNLAITIEWSSNTVIVATTAEPKKIRLERGQTSQLDFAADAYVYPDDDGDGASNLVEVVYAEGNADAMDAVNNPNKTPPGYFSGVVAAVSVPNIPQAIQVMDSTPLAVFSTTNVSGTASNPVFSEQQVHATHLKTRERHSAVLSCSASGFIWDVRQNSVTGDVVGSCGKTVNLVMASPAGIGVLSTLTLSYEAYTLVYGKNGKRLYVMHPGNHAISIINTDPYSEHFFELLTTLKEDVLGNDAHPNRLADNGKFLLVTDDVNGGVIVLVNNNDTEYTLYGSFLAYQIPTPGDIVFHPSGQCAYVADYQLGRIMVIDTTSENPNLWSLVHVVPVAPFLNELAIEATHGSWVYAATANRIVRMDTLTNSITWQQDFGVEGRGTLSDIAIAKDGAFGAVTVGDAAGILVLGRPDPKRMQQSPDVLPNQVDGNQSRVGPSNTISVGWGDMEEEGAINFNSWSLGIGNQHVNFSEDIEDMWYLDTNQETNRLAIALLPTDGFARMNLSTVDADGNVLASAIYALQSIRLATGNGVFLVTPPVPTLPTPIWVGVGAQDFDQAVNFSSYEIVVRPVPDPIPSVDEVEPNNEVDTAQIITSLPVMIHGVADTADSPSFSVYAGGDVEDCYSVDLRSSRIGVRLDYPDDQIDLNLYILIRAINPSPPPDYVFQRLPGQYGMLGAGLSEYFVFEAFMVDVGYGFVCVDIPDDSQPSTANYTITLVDFAF